jgi:hypothetical protein
MWTEQQKSHPTVSLLVDGWKLFLSLLKPRYGSNREYPDDEDDNG